MCSKCSNCNPKVNDCHEFLNEFYVVAYPNAGSLPVALDGPAVGADPARPVTAALKTEDTNARPKCSLNNMVGRPNSSGREELTEGGLPA